MKNLTLPFDLQKANEIAAQFPTPLYVYDEAGIRATTQQLMSAFDGVNGYTNYFAVKATPTPAILRILAEEGMGFDCSSAAELELAKRLGVTGDRIFYTSNNTPKEDFERAIALGAIVNIDDLTQVSVFTSCLKDGYPHAAVRYNPGSLKEGNAIIGTPTEAKYGMTLEQLPEAFKLLKAAGVKTFGLHTMVASNERDPAYFGETARILREAADMVEKACDITIDFLNLGGGFGLNYKLDEDELDLAATAHEIKTALQGSNRRVFTENGRFVTGPHGYLLTRVRYVMQKYKTYIGVDASMHNLMRPGMYGAYHHITVLGKEGSAATYDVVGSLCENNDKFAIDRNLPQIEPGDLLVVHDTGAHGHAMGFNYNGLLRSAEVLMRKDGTFELIRQAETIDDYLRNIIF